VNFGWRTCLNYAGARRIWYLRSLCFPLESAAGLVEVLLVSPVSYRWFSALGCLGFHFFVSHIARNTFFEGDFPLFNLYIFR
jgi:hypothetical protein